MFQFQVRFPAVLQKKALAVTRCNGIILIKCFWICSLTVAGRHSPERTGARLLKWW